jgi:hypothetical protein
MVAAEKANTTHLRRPEGDAFVDSTIMLFAISIEYKKYRRTPQIPDLQAAVGVEDVPTVALQLLNLVFDHLVRGRHSTDIAYAKEQRAIVSRASGGQGAVGRKERA